MSITYSSESFGVKMLSKRVLERAKESFKQKDLPKDKLKEFVAEVVGENMKNCPDTLSKLNLSDSAPLDLFIHLGFGPDEARELAVRATIEHLTVNGHLKD